jgi:hypothetical protein
MASQRQSRSGLRITWERSEGTHDRHITDHGAGLLFCILGGDHSEEFCLDWRRCRVVETEDYDKLMSRAMKSQVK